MIATLEKSLATSGPMIGFAGLVQIGAVINESKYRLVKISRSANSLTPSSAFATEGCDLVEQTPLSTVW